MNSNQGSYDPFSGHAVGLCDTCAADPCTYLGVPAKQGSLVLDQLQRFMEEDDVNVNSYTEVDAWLRDFFNPPVVQEPEVVGEYVVTALISHIVRAVDESDARAAFALDYEEMRDDSEFPGDPMNNAVVVGIAKL